MDIYCRECGNLMVEHIDEKFATYVCLKCEKGVRTAHIEGRIQDENGII